MVGKSSVDLGSQYYLSLVSYRLSNEITFKDAIKNMATKDDIKDMATKAEVREAKMEIRIAKLESKLAWRLLVLAMVLLFLIHLAATGLMLHFIT